MKILKNCGKIKCDHGNNVTYYICLLIIFNFQNIISIISNKMDNSWMKQIKFTPFTEEEDRVCVENMVANSLAQREKQKQKAGGNEIQKVEIS